MPKLGEQILGIFYRLQEKGMMPLDPKSKKGPEFNEQTVRAIIKKEFAEALQTMIVPKLEETLTTMLS